MIIACVIKGLLPSVVIPPTGRADARWDGASGYNIVILFLTGAHAHEDTRGAGGTKFFESAGVPKEIHRFEESTTTRSLPPGRSACG